MQSPLIVQLRGIDKRIAALKAELNYATASDRQQFLAGLSSLEEEKARLAKGVLAGEDVTGNDSESEGEKEDDEEKIATPPSSHVPSLVEFSEDEESLGEDEVQSPVGGNDSAGAASGVIISGKELRQHFHLPLHTAAQKFGICTTAFKKLCRRFGIAKWPHRQLRGIDKKIAALKAELNYATGDREGCWKSLQALQEEKSRISKSTAGGSEGEGVSVVSLQDVRRSSSSKKEEETMSCPLSQHERSACLGPESCASALDLLAAVAGVKEEHDREMEERAKKIRRQALDGEEEFADGCSGGESYATHSDSGQQELDTPPLAPLSPITPPMMPSTRELGLTCTGDIKSGGGGGMVIPPLSALAAFAPAPLCS